MERAWPGFNQQEAQLEYSGQPLAYYAVTQREGYEQPVYYWDPAIAPSGAELTGEEHLLADRKQRIRDVRQGPDGAVYVVTDEENGELWKVTPRR